MELSLNELKKFLYEANAHGYAGDDQNILPQRSGFHELEYGKPDWYFRDSYSGHYYAPGQEVVYYKNEPVWAMAYSGGMKEKYHKEYDDFVHETFTFLKEALLEMDKDKPYRGPNSYKHDSWHYLSNIKGDITDFIGNEKIFHNNELVFEQNFIGGTIK